jgi:hypothetical protein
LNVDDLDKTHPVTGIDTKYYKSDFTDVYTRKFLFDLTGIKNMNISSGRYFLFDKGKFLSEQLEL